MKRKTYSVLLVDDNEDHLLLEKNVIEKMAVISGVDGTQFAERALEMVKEKKYDLLLVDYRIPGMDGLELIKKIHSAGGSPALIMLTGLGSEKVAVEVMKAGAYDYIAKDPAYLERIPGTVEAALEKYELITKLETARKELGRSEAKMRAVIENSPNAIIMKDREGKYLLLNKKATVLIDRFSERNTPEELDEKLDADEEVILSGKKSTVVRRTYNINSEEICLEITKYPILNDDGEVMFLCSLFRDISEQVKMDRMKDNLLRDISHELKTPVSVMTMACDMCSRAIKKKDLKKINKSFGMIERNLKRIQKDVGNIVELFRLNTRKNIGEETVFSVKEIVSDVFEDVKSMLPESGVDLHMDIPSKLDKFLGARRFFRTLIYNLVDNAVKFTDEGFVSVQAVKEEGQLIIKVTDSGCGIAQKNLGKVFDEFFQKNAAIPGTGLGLPICREIVEMYKGRIGVYSQGLGKGTMVCLCFPIDRIQS